MHLPISSPTPRWAPPRRWLIGGLAVTGCVAIAATPLTAVERLSRGQALMKAAEHRQALAECRAGVAQQVNLSRVPVCNKRGQRLVMLDDSGQTLIAAEVFERQGDVAEAARMTCATLEGRIATAKRVAEQACPR